MAAEGGGNDFAACDANAQLVLNRGSQIVPVLLHDRNMISPAPSTCSSLDSSSTAQQSSPAMSSSNQPHMLSTFQYPSPSRENNSSKQFLSKRNRQIPDVNSKASTPSDASRQDASADAQTYENLAINLKNLPPPPVLENEDSISTNVNHVLDHREESSSQTENTSTIRRCNKKDK